MTEVKTEAWKLGWLLSRGGVIPRSLSIEGPFLGTACTRHAVALSTDTLRTVEYVFPSLLVCRRFPRPRCGSVYFFAPFFRFAF